MATEEFTFPIISDDKCPSPIDSPPLWRLSPATSPDPYHHKEPKHFYTAKPKDHYDDDEKEEKMDLLWEDFNEELYRGKSNLEDYNDNGPSRDMVELGCVQALRLSPSKASNGAIFSSSSSSSSQKNGSNKQPGVVVFIKVLKKLFLLHNSHQHHHHRHHHHHHHRHKSVAVKSMNW